MKSTANIRVLAATLLLVLLSSASDAKTPATQCANCAAWNTPQKAFRIYGNTYYVGTHGLGSVLITSDAGHILIDGALPQSAQQIAENIRALGFRVEDVKIILNSHVHFDHAGGIAQLQQWSGARVLASPWSAAVMRSGGPGRGDPQYQGAIKIARIQNVHELTDGQRITVGSLAVVAHFTPGHTPGGTSWTWRSCEGELCRDMVYADSLMPVSSGRFRFTNSREYPHVLDDFDKSFKFFDTTACDILITAHPDASAWWDRLEAREKRVTPDPLVDTTACRQLAQHGRENLSQRLRQEQKK